MTTPSFSVSRMEPICWSHCGFSLLKTLSLCRTAAIEKAYARNSRRALRCFRHRRTSPARVRTLFTVQCLKALYVVFDPGQTPCNGGKCIASTKARSASEPAELVEL